VHHVLSWCKSHVLVEKQLFRFAQAFIMLSLFSVSEELSFTGFCLQTLVNIKGTL
jgi:hypothetical protein